MSFILFLSHGVNESTSKDVPERFPNPQTETALVDDIAPFPPHQTPRIPKECRTFRRDRLRNDCNELATAPGLCAKCVQELEGLV